MAESKGKGRETKSSIRSSRQHEPWKLSPFSLLDETSQKGRYLEGQHFLKRHRNPYMLPELELNRLLENTYATKIEPFFRRNVDGQLPDDWEWRSCYVRFRARWRCFECGMKRPPFTRSHLNVHHLKMRALGGSHDLLNLVCLCCICHKGMPKHSHLQHCMDCQALRKICGVKPPKLIPYPRVPFEEMTIGRAPRRFRDDND